MTVREAPIEPGEKIPAFHLHDGRRGLRVHPVGDLHADEPPQALRLGAPAPGQRRVGRPAESLLPRQGLGVPRAKGTARRGHRRRGEPVTAADRDDRRRAAADQLLDHRGRGDRAGGRRGPGGRGGADRPDARQDGRLGGRPAPHARPFRPHQRHGGAGGADGGADPPPRRRSPSLRQAGRAGGFLRPPGGPAASSGPSDLRRRGDPFRKRLARAPSTRRGTRPVPPASCWKGTEPVLFSGDTLFRRSIGRTDLWGGDTRRHPRLHPREDSSPFPGATPVVCGHGAGTTIEEERRLNPFAAL